MCPHPRLPPLVAKSGSAAARYLPDPQRAGVGLALSGGGFRATLFHLGALRRLHEYGLLAALDTVTGVSGGAIALAGLAAGWAAADEPRPLGGAPPQRPADASSIGRRSRFDREIAAPLAAFTARNIRTPAIFGMLLPWNWRRSDSELLARQYRRLTRGRGLASLPARPRFCFLATDLAYGTGWRFARDHLGDWRAGYGAPSGVNAAMARAVAASSAFPPVFAPLAAGVRPEALRGGAAPPGPQRDRHIRGLRLADGGIYDNLGLEPIWRNHAIVLVSDGGAPFAFAPDSGAWLGQVRRDVAVMGNQSTAVRKRWLIANFLSGQMTGAYWGIASAAAHYDPGAPGYSAALAAEVIAGIRTDLDAFSPAEAAVLQNHGYSLLDAALRRHLPQLLPSPAPPFTIPYPEWQDEDRVRAALAGSWRRTFLGRGRAAALPPPQPGLREAGQTAAE